MYLQKSMFSSHNFTPVFMISPLYSVFYLKYMVSVAKILLSEIEKRNLHRKHKVSTPKTEKR